MDHDDNAKYGSNLDEVAEAKIDAIHDAPVPGENHNHTDAHPAVISGTEARGGDPNGAGFNIYWISTLLIVIGMVVVFFLFAR